MHGFPPGSQIVKSLRAKGGSPQDTEMTETSSVCICLHAGAEQTVSGGLVGEATASGKNVTVELKLGHWTAALHWHRCQAEKS